MEINTNDTIAEMVHDETYAADMEAVHRSAANGSKNKGMELPSKVLFHLEPARFDDETFDQYKERRSENNAYIKAFLKQGTSFKRPF